MERIACCYVNRKDIENYLFKAIPYILVKDDCSGYKTIVLDDGVMKYAFQVDTCQVLRTTIGDVSIIVPSSSGVTIIH